MKERLTTYHCGKAVIKDKSKLSEAIEKLAEFEEKEKRGEWLDAIELAKIAIALQSQKWIPVSERLPKKHEDALTTTRYDGIHGTTIDTSEEDCYAVHGANSKEEAIEIWNNRVEHLKELDQQTGCEKIFEEMQKNQLR